MIEKIIFTKNILSELEASTPHAKCFSDVVLALTDYLTISAQEKTNRSKIRAWEAVKLSEIKLDRDLLIDYLERSFDERAKTFAVLFQVVDQAVSCHDTQQLAATLQAIIELAKSSPFKNLTDLTIVKTALADSNHVWEL